MLVGPDGGVVTAKHQPPFSALISPAGPNWPSSRTGYWARGLKLAEEALAARLETPPPGAGEYLSRARSRPG